MSPRPTDRELAHDDWVAPDGRRLPGGQQSTRNLDLEVTLRFSLRPAGHKGNDSSAVLRTANWCARMLVPVIRYGAHLYGDESFWMTSRWRRRGERWKPIDLPRPTGSLTSYDSKLPPDAPRREEVA